MKNCKDLSRYRELVPTKQKEMKAMEEELMQMEQKEQEKNGTGSGAYRDGIKCHADWRL